MFQIARNNVTKGLSHHQYKHAHSNFMFVHCWSHDRGRDTLGISRRGAWILFPAIIVDIRWWSLALPQLSLGRGCGANPHQAEPSRLSPVPSWCVFWQWTPAFLSWTRATAPAPTHRRGCRHGHSSNIFPGDCSTSHCIDCIYCLCPSFLAFPWCSEGLSFDECSIINISNWYNISAYTYFEFAAGK